MARHGKTLWNEQNRVCGRTDIALTEKGIAQAKALAQEAKKYNVDLIISSPLRRATETSKIVANHCNVPAIVDQRLIEQDYGIFEGADRQDPAFLEFKRNFAYQYPNGESMMQVACRVYGLLDEIRNRYHDQNVLLISHGGICRIIRTYFIDMTNEEFIQYTQENGKLIEYSFGGK